MKYLYFYLKSNGYLLQGIVGITERSYILITTTL